jgi:hypothetical protein
MGQDRWRIGPTRRSVSRAFLSIALLSQVFRRSFRESLLHEALADETLAGWPCWPITIGEVPHQA